MSKHLLWCLIHNGPSTYISSLPFIHLLKATPLTMIFPQAAQNVLFEGYS